MKRSLRLGVLLTALVGINVYVFFFNRTTAPREVLNLQSTSKTFEAAKKDTLTADVRRARELVTSASVDARRPAASPAVRPPVEAAVADAPAPAQPAAAPVVIAAATPPVIRIPYAPPPDSVASRAPAQRTIEIPFAPPPEDDGAAADAQGQQGVEKQFAAADTLGQVLAREGFGAAGPNVIAALNKLVDPRTIRGGARYVVHVGDDGTPDGFEYQPTPALRYLVEREDGDGTRPTWTARKLEATVEIKTVQAGGVVESSLYESVQKSGEPTALVGLLVELFAWDVNFYIDTHPGDRWKVVVEKQYLSGQFYKYGRVLAAEYGGKVGTFRAFYWAGKDAPRDRPGKYYDEKGLAVSKTMLKTPLRFVRISSKFDRKRLHPILHVERAHLGIDYAAPVGTPVWASASGRVVEAGMKRGSGNTVVIAHANGLSTRYYHLSKFARGLRAGMQVRQKDVIGFVGTTGLSTGPHLHFSLTRNGAFVDPSKLQINRDAPVPDRGAFIDAIRPRIAAMKAMQLGVVARN
jgi:murein DD-endopeptidase MepM/ murein hydrolase activator NlpD